MPSLPNLNLFRRRSGSGGSQSASPPATKEASASTSSAMDSGASAAEGKEEMRPALPSSGGPQQLAQSPIPMPALPGLRAAITRFPGEDDQGYERRIALIEEWIAQHPPMMRSAANASPPPRPAAFGGGAAAGPSICVPPPPALLSDVTRLAGESEQAFAARINKMTEEVGSYCASQSYVRGP